MSESLNCAELVELVTQYLEDALSPQARHAFENHLSNCRGCAAYLQQMRLTITLTGMLTEANIEKAAQDELLHVFRNWKSET
jgi:anti-sigma factor RsiW